MKGRIQEETSQKIAMKIVEGKYTLYHIEGGITLRGMAQDEVIAANLAKYPPENELIEIISFTIDIET